MLALSRKVGETIAIGDNIKATVTRIERGQVYLSFEAPKEVLILRTELIKKAAQEGDQG